MDYLSAKNYLLSKPEASESYPFTAECMVPKIYNKMFATLSFDNKNVDKKNNPSAQLNLKCDPDKANALRDLFTAVIPGYHMNKKHWNTVILDGSIPDSDIELMIDESYALVLKQLTKLQRQQLELHYSKQQLYAHLQ